METTRPKVAPNSRPEGKFGTDRYYGVGSSIRGDKWLVIFSKDGIMETAFPPDRFEGYLEKRGFEELGKVGEVVKDEKR